MRNGIAKPGGHVGTAAARRGAPQRAGGAGAGDVLALIRSGAATTRAQVMDQTGLSRSTVAQRLDALLRAGYLVETSRGDGGRGRPTSMLAINRMAGVVLVADVGASHSRCAVTDMAGEPMAERTFEVDVARGPDVVLGRIKRALWSLLDEAGREPRDVRGVGLGVPGPVEFTTGRVVSPPIMTGWDGYRIPEYFDGDLDCPVLVDNDVNLMAIGEHRARWPPEAQLLFIKIGTGVGAGIVLAGGLHRGALGAAGDLGHIPAPVTSDVRREPPACRCGNVGCIEAYAGGWALVRDLRAHGLEVESARDVVAAVRSGNHAAQQMVREAGRILGHAVADVVSLLNPSVVVIGGDLVHAGERLLAGIREIVYQRALPLATRDLQIMSSQLDDRAGVIGAAAMITDALFEPAVVDAVLQ